MRHAGRNKTLWALIVVVLSIISSACGGGGGGDSPSPATPDTVPPVVFATPAGGTFNAAQSVTLTASETADIYYTLDGATPTTASQKYSAPISISTNKTLKFFARDSAGNDSAVATETYVIDANPPVVSAKVGGATSAGGPVPGTTFVTLSSTKAGTIYFTTDGSAATTASKIYYSPIMVNPLQNTTLRFMAKDTAGSSSSEVSVTYQAGDEITQLRVKGTGSGSGVPFTVGQVFATGHMQPADGLLADLGGGVTIPLQLDVKATHADGSVRHAVISGVVPSVASGVEQVLSLRKTTSLGNTPAVTPQALAAAGLAAQISITLDSVAYAVALEDLIAAGPPAATWLSGPIASEWFFVSPLKRVDTGAAHPHLQVRFGVRAYAGTGAGIAKARVETIVENTTTFTAAPQNFVYAYDLSIAGVTKDSKPALTHYHHARWHQYHWWDGVAPPVHVKHHAPYLIASKAIANYDQSVVPSESALAALITSLDTPYQNPTPNGTGKTGPMTIGLAVPFMGQTGGRPDIGPMPSWAVLYLLSGDLRAREAMLAGADGSGSWSIHYRDEATGQPVRLDTTADHKNISTHVNLALSGPLPVPRCANHAPSLCVTPFTADAAHQPSLVYFPYLITGDYYYLEELLFWTSRNPLETSPGSRNFEKGLVKWDQVRAQAWSMRTMGHAAYIAPDAHPSKAYYVSLLENNLEFYKNTYAIGNPNNLGVYDGSGGGFLSTTGQSAPWQDDFLTWTFGYLTGLGFSNAASTFTWKAKFPIGRMTAPDYCWIDGAVSAMNIRTGGQTGPVFGTFAEVWAETKKNDPADPLTATRIANGDPSINLTTTTPYASLPCNSQAQADWRTTAQNPDGAWVPGRMSSFAQNPDGFPSNMQPALAISATSGVANGAEAWAIFAGRTVKPNYSSQPQWAVVPGH